LRAIWNSIADYIRECDKLLLSFCIIAGGYGCIAVWSATNYIGSNRQFITQLVTLVLGVAAIVVISNVDYNHYKKLWPLIVLGTLIPVILTFFIGFAPEGTDDKAWLRLPGGLTFQPAELLKIAFIISYNLCIFYTYKKNANFIITYVCTKSHLFGMIYEGRSVKQNEL
jgi:rod shape determining protein RodA